MTPCLRIGHRGAAGYEPENTLGSFARALACGVDMIELDVRLCGSGEVVVIHDETTDRVTGVAGVVNELPLVELQALDAGTGEHIPTLGQVLDAVNRRCRINIEIKESAAVQPMLAVIAQYRHRGWRADDFLISSFNHLDLWRVKELDACLPIGALATVIPPDFDTYAEELGVASVHAHHESVVPALAEALHQRKICLYAYTVNDPAHISAVRASGVDGIISDFPDRI